MSENTLVYFDTEFTGLHQNTTLISIGLVSDSGETFYAELTDYDKTYVREEKDQWLQHNVINNLILNEDDFHQGVLYTKRKNSTIRGKKEEVKKHLTSWFKQFDNVIIWSDCLSYDWVLFNNLFGTAFDIPNNINYIPRDICTLFDLMNIDPDISREEFANISIEEQKSKHNSLYDAKVIKKCYDKLISQ